MIEVAVKKSCIFMAEIQPKIIKRCTSKIASSPLSFNHSYRQIAPDQHVPNDPYDFQYILTGQLCDLCSGGLVKEPKNQSSLKVENTRN